MEVSSGEVTSNHHQAVNKPAEGLRVSAMSNDKLVEAIEWADPVGKGFLMGVQWHPERMERGNPLAEALLRGFLARAHD
jgi:putative glutamine amidotransferase